MGLCVARDSSQGVVLRSFPFVDARQVVYERRADGKQLYSSLDDLLLSATFSYEGIAIRSFRAMKVLHLLCHRRADGKQHCYNLDNSPSKRSHTYTSPRTIRTKTNPTSTITPRRDRDRPKCLDMSFYSPAPHYLSLHSLFC